MAYLWVKALHIIFVASWFAGLFYLPRIFVNLAMVEAGSTAERERLLLMGGKLQRFANGLMLIALGSGLWLWLGSGLWSGPGNGWLHAKLSLVIAVVIYHLHNGRVLKGFVAGTDRRTHRWYRVYNEVSVLLFSVIVILVAVKPF